MKKVNSLSRKLLGKSSKEAISRFLDTSDIPDEKISFCFRIPTHELTKQDLRKMAALVG